MVKNYSVESLFLFFLLYCYGVESRAEGRETLIASSVSKTFGSVVNTVSVWEKYQSLIHRARTFSTEKEIYSALCDDFLIIEYGTMSFCLDKESRKNCIMLSPKLLQISWLHDRGFWQWISIPESRFEKVPKLIKGVPFKISGVMDSKMLSQRTWYSAYVVYKTIDQFHEYESIGTGMIQYGPPEARKFGRMYLTKIEERGDGWMEAKFGEFFNEGDNEIWFYISEITYLYWNLGFIIQGIEFRHAKNSA